MEINSIKVKELIECLSTFNPEADFHVILKGIEFEIGKSSLCWTTEKKPEPNDERDIEKEKLEATDVAIIIKTDKI